MAKREKDTSAILAPSGLDPGFAPEFLDYPGSIQTSAMQADGKMLIGGSFETLNGIRIGGLARLNADNSLDGSFSPKIDSTVSAIAVQLDGKIVIGGSFTHVDGVPRNRIARLNPDGSLDVSFDPGGGFDNSVYSLALQSDKILAAGFYTNFQGWTVAPLVRLNSDGSLDDSFHVEMGEGALLFVATMPNGKILVSGSLYDPFQENYFFLACYNPDGSLDTSFNPGGMGPNSIVRDRVVQADGKIIIVGDFTNYNGIARSRIARLNSDGSLDTQFDPGGANGNVYSISLLNSGKMVLGGSFTTYSGESRKYLTQILADGSLDESFSVGNGFNSYVYEARGLSSGRIFAGGAFNNYDGGFYDIGIILEENGAASDLVSFEARSRAKLATITRQPDGKVLVGGYFDFVNGTDHRNIVRLNSDGSVDPEFDPGTGPNSQVYTSVVLADGKILIGGQFTSFNGMSRNRLARLNPDGTLDPTFVGGTSGFVSNITVLPDNKLLIGGQFSSVNGVQRFGIARLNPDGTLDDTFNALLGFSFVEGIGVQPDGKIIVGGQFGGLEPGYNSLVRLDANGNYEPSFTPGLEPDSGIYSLAIQPDGKILIGGTFWAVGATLQNGVARLNPDGSRDLSFQIGDGTNINDDVEHIVLQPDGKILLGGSISMIDGTAVRNLVRLNSDGTRDMSSNINTDSTIWDLELADSDPEKLYAAGDFTSTNGQERLGAARYDLSEQTLITSPFDFDGDGRTDISVFRPSDGNWWVSGSSSVVNVVTFGAANDVIVPADYTGDGKTDQAVWRPETGEWFVLRSDGTGYYGFTFGAAGDIPVPADYDGDGKADPAVFRSSDSTWYIFTSAGGVETVTFGSAGDTPAPADYDGDGKTDIAVVRSNGTSLAWWIRSSATLNTTVSIFGADGDKLVEGDYTGDGRADIAVWRPSTGEWFVLQSEDAQYYAFVFGVNGDLPVLGDYDGDGKFDAAVFRPSDSNWYVNGSTSGIYIQRYGAADDRPIPNAFVR